MASVRLLCGQMAALTRELLQQTYLQGTGQQEKNSKVQKRDFAENATCLLEKGKSFRGWGRGMHKAPGPTLKPRTPMSHLQHLTLERFLLLCARYCRGSVLATWCRSNVYKSCLGHLGLMRLSFLGVPLRVITRTAQTASRP